MEHARWAERWGSGLAVDPAGPGTGEGTLGPDVGRTLGSDIERMLGSTIERVAAPLGGAG